MKHISCDQYQVVFGSISQTLPSFIKDKAYSSIVVIIDENTGVHCLPYLMEIDNIKIDNIIELAAGETNKNLDTCKDIWQQMLAHGMDRKALCINLGGGVIGDMGGFCASSYMRGIDFIHIPTTLLAQVDASVGGKLGVNLESVKNMIGTFNFPEAVFIDVAFLKTLPSEQIRSGYGEMFKHALIADFDYLRQLDKIDIFSSDISEDLVLHSVQIKANVVIADPYEIGMRKTLNFGHTIGHAYETLSHRLKKPMLHGEAVFAGMASETIVARNIGLISKELATEILDILNSKYICTNINFLSFFEELKGIMQKDKKNERNDIRMSLINGRGSCDYDISVPTDIIHASVAEYLKTIRTITI